MLKKGIALLIIIASIYVSFKALLPSKISDLSTEKTQFSTERALIHLDKISQKPHFVGTKEHKKVRNYIVSELQKLGIKTEIQEGYSITSWGNLTKSKNILARLKGSENGKALMLLTHYDSNPHSAIGASDAGSGVVTILESLRAFLAEGKQPKNDIIILISDAEELGLNGADLFVKQHEWAKDVGLVLNFEARGSGGPSYMLIETNGGNANLMKAFVAANPQYPVANSLAYSIYKMLPNDTDLTVFRRDKNIDGFNFAFIDDHFDYHTVKDNFERLDRNTLEHQGSYLMPLLEHFSNSNLENVKANEDYIYFNAPFVKTVIYPFSWILPMLCIAILIFIGLLIYGFRQKVLKTKTIGRGFLVFILALVFGGLVTFLGWEGILLLYPEYNEILHGFTYNGHTYIWFFVFLTLSICFYLYSKTDIKQNVTNTLIAPLTIWLIICGFVALKLEGASFFIIPVYFALLSLFLLIRQKKPDLILLALLSIPVLFIMVPFIKMFPVGLGLKMLFVSAIFVVLIFGFLLPVFGYFKHKKRWSYLFLFFGIIMFCKAHINSSFKPDTPKPNSLIYSLNTDTNKAHWATYDHVLDSWTANFLGKTPNKASSSNNTIFSSKYKTTLSYTKEAPLKALPNPIIEITSDTIINSQRQFKITVTPQREVQRFDVFSNSENSFNTFKINGVLVEKTKGASLVFTERKNNRLFSYFIVDKEPLEMEITIPQNQKNTTLELYESSFDLLTNSQFTVPERELNMIPKPFVLNDAVILKKTIVIE
ncbi:M20/M25/M40 family metallo-hydrolase [Lacinutrix sp. Bg11-31]|uniref:M20/M25/M40 family metallo-hydrolase n=1 Tax=Lacinutrix sp. Bg11-31 TaxID=2057808 RepID=UPI000C30E12F|nr:M20/M25/M40 family metallo-hydrolase [Lacinutrix sp. Bg11-31]AUC82798.1 peptidase M28 [Lacinutrix sp. Bg11-31]